MRCACAVRDQEERTSVAIIDRPQCPLLTMRASTSRLESVSSRIARLGTEQEELSISTFFFFFPPPEKLNAELWVRRNDHSVHVELRL